RPSMQHLALWLAYRCTLCPPILAPEEVVGHLDQSLGLVNVPSSAHTVGGAVFSCDRGAKGVDAFANFPHLIQPVHVVSPPWAWVEGAAGAGNSGAQSWAAPAVATLVGGKRFRTLLRRCFRTRSAVVCAMRPIGLRPALRRSLSGRPYLRRRRSTVLSTS